MHHTFPQGPARAAAGSAPQAGRQHNVVSLDTHRIARAMRDPDAGYVFAPRDEDEGLGDMSLGQALVMFLVVGFIGFILFAMGR